MVTLRRTMRTTVRESAGDRVFLAVIYVLCVLAGVVTLYPFVYVFSMSISSAEHVLAQTVRLLPRGLSLSSYRTIFRTSEVWTAYGNTIWYTVVGTVVNIVLTICVAYPLSRKNFVLRKPLTFFIAFTMFFSGGLIPLFILVRNLGMHDTRLALVLPKAVIAYYVIIARTFFQHNIPESLNESAEIDGANDLRIIWSLVLPLSQPIIAVLHWNSYFHAMIFLPSLELQPLQLYLVRVLVAASPEMMLGVEGTERTVAGIQLKYAVIIVAVLPIICVYPFLQRHFVKGVMIGAIKG